MGLKFDPSHGFLAPKADLSSPPLVKHPHVSIIFFPRHIQSYTSKSSSIQWHLWGSSHPHVLQLDPIIAEKLTMFRPSFEEVGEEKTQQEAKDMATQVWRNWGCLTLGQSKMASWEIQHLWHLWWIFPSYKPPLNSGISQLARSDYRDDQIRGLSKMRCFAAKNMAKLNGSHIGFWHILIWCYLPSKLRFFNSRTAIWKHCLWQGLGPETLARWQNTWRIRTACPSTRWSTLSLKSSLYISKWCYPKR